MKEVYKIGAIIIEDKKLLVVKEKDGDTFISVGGKPEKGETYLEKEELNVRLIDAKPMERFGSNAIGSYRRITMDVYFVKIAGKIKLSSEIENFCWVGKKYKQQNMKLAPLLEKVITPKLIEMNLIE